MHKKSPLRNNHVQDELCAFGGTYLFNTHNDPFSDIKKESAGDHKNRNIKPGAKDKMLVFHYRDIQSWNKTAKDHVCTRVMSVILEIYCRYWFKSK